MAQAATASAKAAAIPQGVIFGMAIASSSVGKPGNAFCQAPQKQKSPTSFEIGLFLY
jgi:hypothetical protein